MRQRRPLGSSPNLRTRSPRFSPTTQFTHAELIPAHPMLFIPVKMGDVASDILLSFSKSVPEQTAPVVPEQASASTRPSASNPSQAPSTSGSSQIPPKTAVNWTEEMCLMLCREVDFVNPFQYRPRTKESGKAWEDITDNLRHHGLNVNKRAVRDKYYKLKDSVNKRNRNEEKASGIAPELTGTEAELTQMIEDLTDMENDSKDVHAQQQQKEERKQLDGVEMRKKALETFTETSKRTKSEQEGPSRKRRNTGSDATEFLLRKLEMDRDVKEKEFQLRREEAEIRRQDEERRRQMEDREEERRRQDEEKRREREEREEERRRRDEERRREKEEKEEERRRKEEERRRKEDADRDRRMELLQQQLLQQNQMIMMMLKNQKKE